MQLGMSGLGLAGECGDDIAAEGGAWFGAGGGMAFGTGGVGGETLLPVGTQGGVIEYGFGLGNRRCESVQRALAGGSDETVVGVLHDIGVGATVAGAENDFVVAGEFARYGVERMREDGACHNYEVLVFGDKDTNNL